MIYSEKGQALPTLKLKTKVQLEVLVEEEICVLVRILSKEKVQPATDWTFIYEVSLSFYRPAVRLASFAKLHLLGF